MRRVYIKVARFVLDVVKSGSGGAPMASPVSSKHSGRSVAVFMSRRINLLGLEFGCPPRKKKEETNPPALKVLGREGKHLDHPS